MVGDVEILLPIKFRWITFSGCREEVENGLAYQRPFCLSDRPENTIWIEDVEILLYVKFHWIPFSDCRKEAETLPLNQRPGRWSWIPIGLKNTKAVRDVDFLLHAKSVEFCSAVANRSWKQIRGQGCHLGFPIGQKNTNLVKDVRWIPFRSGREEVDNVSANQRPGGHLGFSICPKNINLVENFKILLSVKFRFIPLIGCREEVENVSANERPGWSSWFSNRPAKY